MCIIVMMSFKNSKSNAVAGDLLASYNQFPACVSEVTRVRPKHYGSTL